MVIAGGGCGVDRSAKMPIRDLGVRAVRRAAVAP
jgi:hypothetical protein